MAAGGENCFMDDTKLSQQSTAKRLVGFFALSLALGIAPGPDILFVLTQALSQGPAAGFFVTLGLATGLCVHISLAAFGIGGVIKRFPKSLPLITWCGAVYLLYLAWRTWCNASPSFSFENGADVTSLPSHALYLRGVIMNLCNPKVILFFLALMPRFIVEGRLSPAIQFLILGLIFIIATLLVFNCVALAGGFVADFLTQNDASSILLQRVSAVIMVVIALWISFENIRRGKTVNA